MQQRDQGVACLCVLDRSRSYGRSFCKLSGVLGAAMSRLSLQTLAACCNKERVARAGHQTSSFQKIRPPQHSWPLDMRNVDHENRMRCNQKRHEQRMISCGTAAATAGAARIAGANFKRSPAHHASIERRPLAALALYGTSSYFVTFIRNPHWPARCGALLPGGAWREQPDIVNGVFRKNPGYSHSSTSTCTHRAKTAMPTGASWPPPCAPACWSAAPLRRHTAPMWPTGWQSSKSTISPSAELLRMLAITAMELIDRKLLAAAPSLTPENLAQLMAVVTSTDVPLARHGALPPHEQACGALVRAPSADRTPCGIAFVDAIEPPTREEYGLAADWISAQRTGRQPLTKYARPTRPGLSATLRYISHFS